MYFNKNKLSYIFDKLYPICRSITGEGFKKSLNILAKEIPLKQIKYKTGIKVFDWKVPQEWNIKEAFIKYKNKKVIDFKVNNLHIVNFSVPKKIKLNLKELKKKIHTLKNRPNLIPYVTSYYKKNWGFCESFNKLKKFKEGTYNIVIKSNFKNGYLVNGIDKIKGKSKKTCLITSYLCHPSMANNELSGPLVLLGLHERIQKWDKRNLTYTFLINPETIGSICFLSRYKKFLKQNMLSGLVLTCLGGSQKKISYKLSRSADSPLDKLAKYLFNKKKIFLREFDPCSGSDERQYCASSLNLPMGQFSRTIYGQYKEYHTSGDTKEFMNIKKIYNSIDSLEAILKINDKLFPIKRFIPYGELQLGKRNLYPNINSPNTRNFSNDENNDGRKNLNILLEILSYADGKLDILDIVKKRNIELDRAIKILDICIGKKLVKLIN
jgi:aminopeptidase-like protein